MSCKEVNSQIIDDPTEEDRISRIWTKRMQQPIAGVRRAGGVRTSSSLPRLRASEQTHASVSHLIRHGVECHGEERKGYRQRECHRRIQEEVFHVV